MSLLKHTNVIHLPPTQFVDYLKIPAQSFSSLKQTKDGIVQEFFVTERVTIGKIVDDIITNGGSESSITHPQYNEAKDIVNCMMSEFGDVLKYMSFQDSFTGTLVFDDFQMNIKGRTDARLKKVATTDIKVTNDAKSKEDCIKLINYMRYDAQILNYKSLSQDKHAFIFMHSRKVNKTFFIKMFITEEQIQTANDWWIGKILENGVII